MRRARAQRVGGAGHPAFRVPAVFGLGEEPELFRSMKMEEVFGGLIQHRSSLDIEILGWGQTPASGKAPA
jgi:hypothetical protein